MIVWREHPYPGRLVAFLGSVEAGAVLPHDAGADWTFFLPTTGYCALMQRKRARSVEKAKAAVESATDDWLRKAGVLGEIEEQPMETAA